MSNSEKKAGPSAPTSRSDMHSETTSPGMFQAMFNERSCFAILLFGCLSYAMIWLILFQRFSTGDITDNYQYCHPFSGHHQFLDIRFPLIGNSPPFSESWGIQWPFHMVIKSLIFSIIPYSATSINLLSFLVLIAGSMIVFKNTRQISGSAIVGLFAAIVALTDRMLLGHSASGRPEVLTCILFLVLVNQARVISNNEHQQLRAGFLIPFALLPGMHHFGLMIVTGLLAIHVLFFRILYPRGTKWLHWGPLAGYFLGVSLLISWFVAKPAAWEQMQINLLVQDAIYETATRFTFFSNFLTSPPMFSGYVLYVPALILGLLIAAMFLREVIFGCSKAKITPDILYAGAIIVALPVLGFIFQVDNFFHFAIGSYTAVYLLVSIEKIVKLRTHFCRVVLMSILVYLSVASSTYTGWKVFQFHKLGYPNLSEERLSILKSYQDSGKIYIPTDLTNEALELFPEKCQFYTFPMPILPKTRKAYEQKVLTEAKSGDILIVHSDPMTISLRLLKRPIENFTPPNVGEWEFVKKHVKKLAGRSTDWGWDFSVYRHK